MTRRPPHATLAAARDPGRLRLTALALLLAVLGLAEGVGPIRAQETGAAALERVPPQILSPDLARVHRTGSERLTVTFVVVDSDAVVAVSINGEPRSIVPGDTVLVTEVLVPTQRVTEVAVTARDERGNTRTKTFAIVREDLPAEVGTRPFAHLQARLEVDDNPGLDRGASITLSGVDDRGTVPDDEQSDVRRSVRATAGVIRADWHLFAGYLGTRYGKARHRPLELDAVYAGGGLQPALKSGWRLTYVGVDIDLGGADYARAHTLSPGYVFRSGPQDDRRRHLLALDATCKNFARAAQRDDAQFAFKWDYRRRHGPHHDVFRSVVSAGTVTEGTPRSEYRFAGFDLDWALHWGTGFKLDTGFGLQTRDFPENEPQTRDTALGDTRVDNLFRASLGAGYRFTQRTFALLGYRHVLNLSNDAPYERRLYGLTVEAVF